MNATLIFFNILHYLPKFVFG